MGFGELICTNMGPENNYLLSEVGTLQRQVIKGRVNFKKYVLNRSKFYGFGGHSREGAGMRPILIIPVLILFLILLRLSLALRVSTA